MGDMELQIFADRLKELRQKLNITQKEFAEKIGITAAALSSYENNIKNPSIAVAKRIAEAFNVSIDWLCGLTDKKTYNDDIETWGDIIHLLIKLDQKVFISLSIEYSHEDSNIPQDVSINILEPVIKEFIGEWEKMKKLHDAKTIDDDLYNLWIEKTIKKYNTFPNLNEEFPFDPPQP